MNDINDFASAINQGEITSFGEFLSFYSFGEEKLKMNLF